MRLAARNPERVDRMVAARAPAPSSTAGERLDRARRAVRAQGAARGRRVPSSSAGSLPRFLDGQPRTCVRRASDGRRHPRRGLRRLLRGRSPRWTCARPAGVAAPTLAIAGADDPATPPPTSRRSPTPSRTAGCSSSRGSAHLANAEQPGVITPAIIEHLENVMTRQGRRPRRRRRRRHRRPAPAWPSAASAWPASRGSSSRRCSSRAPTT